MINMTKSGALGHGIVGLVIGPLVRGQTYKQLAYLALSIPLAMVYWMVLGFGLIFGVILTIVLVGVVILLVTVLVTRPLVAFERWLANHLLAVDIGSANDLETPPGKWGAVRRYLDASSTWRGLGFLSMKFWFAIIALVLLYGLYQAISMISTIVHRPLEIDFGEINGEPVVWSVETIGDVVIAVPVGIGLVIVVVHLINGFGYIAARMSEALLGEPR